MKGLFYILLIAAALGGCSANDYQMYTGEACLQFTSSSDTVKRYSFYFRPAVLAQDTVWFEVRTTGYTSKEVRPFRIVQHLLPETNNAVEGVHYKKFGEMEYTVGAGVVFARVPVVLYRNQLAVRTTYYLELRVEGNDEFILGEKEQLRRTVVFSKDLLKPDGWSVYYENQIFGAYSINKHAWMIEQTEKKWDDEFFKQMADEPGADIYWRDKLNEYLAEYNRNGGILQDDNENEITGFPK